VVLDTNILVAAARSSLGASFKLLSLVGTGRFDITISVPLVLEYEDALMRQLETGALEMDEIAVEDLLDYLCVVGVRQDIFFLWRPLMPDPADDLILEAAVAGRCDAIVTFNRRHFAGIDRFGLRALQPREFLREIGDLP